MHSDSFSKLYFQHITFKYFCVLFMTAILTACVSAPSVKEQTKLDLHIEVSCDVNLDNQGRAAPIVLRLYEFKSTTNFDASDFFSLQTDGKNVLGADALVTDEFILRPGNKQVIRRKTHPETILIGVLAGFRDIGKSIWRSTYALKVTPDASWYRAVIPLKKENLKVFLDQQTISITELD
ncbi:type VI secretion system lipoprotein TssJ [Glaciimonas sp. GG7]